MALLARVNALCASLLLLGTTPLLSAEKEKSKKPDAPEILWLTDLDKAIAQVQETGKLLLIDNGWEREGT
jgi:hypothetical protein